MSSHRHVFVQGTLETRAAQLHSIRLTRLKTRARTFYRLSDEVGSKHLSKCRILKKCTAKDLPSGLLKGLLDSLLIGRIRIQPGLLRLAPLGHLVLHVVTSLLVLGIPVHEGRLSLGLGLEDTKQVLLTKGVNGLRLVELVGRTPAVLELALDDGRLLRQLSQHLLIQRRHRLVGVLWKLSPDALEDVRLGLAWHVLLGAEELLQVLRVLLHLVTGHDVL
mmetsp:Transcript_67501/g.108732  ORF Transcript_67501/g.108732 Transcript_67501/m.108732 type:complete len:220 (+) Transcript_67501:27-686(+)